MLAFVFLLWALIVPTPIHAVNFKALTTDQEELGDKFGCSDEQIATINDGIDEAILLASKASHALSELSSITETPYLDWFGKDSREEHTNLPDDINHDQRASIKTNQYDSIVSKVKKATKFTGLLSTLTGNDVLFLCGISSGRAIAVTTNPQEDQNAYTLIGLSQAFFASSVSLAELKKAINKGAYRSPSVGFALLHEFQHADIIVGVNHHKEDVVVESHNAVSMGDCQGLDPADKIRNAQNFAFYAATIAAQEGATCNILRKRNYDSYVKRSCQPQVFAHMNVIPMDAVDLEKALLNKLRELKRGSNRKDSGKASSEKGGSNAKASNANRSNAKGSNSKGLNAKGYQGKGSYAKGSNAKGSNAKGSNAKGSNAKGSNAKGFNAKGSQANAKGYQGKGSYAKGSNAKGSNAKGSNAKGSRANAKGSSAKGRFA